MANHNSFIHNIGLNENNSLSHLLETISPDMEDESNIIEESKYYDDTDFKDALQQYNSKISILSLNCQSINAKYDKLKLFLNDVNTLNPISIICVQESWCHDEIDINCFSLPNYTLTNSYRRLTAHGGLIMYVHDNFAFKEINEKLPITHTFTLFESLFVEVWRKSSIYKKYVIGNIYRLPSYISDNIKSFINEFTALLNDLSIRSKSVYLCGDYNIDLLKIHTVEDYSSFFDNVIAFSFVPKITLPTRICDTRSSLIDNIYTNTIDKDHTSGILIRPISDHQMYFSIMNENVTTTKSIQKYIEIEVCSQENMDRFKIEVANTDLYNKLNQDLNTDRNYNYDILSAELQAAKNLHIPRKIRKFNRRKHKKEKWMINDLLLQIVKKNKKYVK